MEGEGRKRDFIILKVVRMNRSNIKYRHRKLGYVYKKERTDKKFPTFMDWEKKVAEEDRMVQRSRGGKGIRSSGRPQTRKTGRTGIHSLVSCHSRIGRRRLPPYQSGHDLNRFHCFGISWPEPRQFRKRASRRSRPARRMSPWKG